MRQADQWPTSVIIQMRLKIRMKTCAMWANCCRLVVEAFVVAGGKFCLSSQQGVVRINGRGEQL